MKEAGIKNCFTGCWAMSKLPRLFRSMVELNRVWIPLFGFQTVMSIFQLVVHWNVFILEFQCLLGQSGFAISHPALPKKISVSMWRAWHNCLPVDDEVRRLNIPMVSRCNYCLTGQEENLDDILAKGELAEQVWARFISLEGLPSLQGRS